MNPERKSNIILIGYRCTGKTTVGSRLALLTGRHFVDTDDRFAERFGTIADFVAAHGWEAFRDREAGILEAVCRNDDTVVATGGGIVLRPANVALMKARGLVVWLKASLGTISQRMAADPASRDSRPGLTDYPLPVEIEKTLAERAPLYEEAMDIRIDTDGMAVEEICRRVIAATVGKG